MIGAVPGIIGSVVGGIQAIAGGENLRRDKDELSKLSPAFYKIQDEYYNNYNQAAGLAGQGLTSAAKDYYGDMAGRGLGTAASAVAQVGGSPNDINKIFQSYNDSIQKLGVSDSEAQISNIKYFQQVGKDLAGQKTQQWVINEYTPYQNKLKELTQRIEADKKNIWGGITSIVGGAQAAVTGSQNEKLLSRLLGGGSPGAGGATSILGDAATSIFGGAMEGFSEGIDIPDPFGVTDKTGTRIPGLLNQLKSAFESGELTADDLQTLSREFDVNSPDRQY